MKNNRTRIATAATLTALGVLGAVALAAGSGSPDESQPAATTTTAPEVRTVVERRTVNVVRHARPTRSAQGAAPAVAPAAPAPTPVALSNERSGTNVSGDRDEQADDRREHGNDHEDRDDDEDREDHEDGDDREHHGEDSDHDDAGDDD